MTKRISKKGIEKIEKKVFAEFEEMGIDLVTAQNILKKLYAAGLGVDELEWAINKLSNLLEERAELKMLQGASDADIEKVATDIMEIKKQEEAAQAAGCAMEACSQKPFSEGGYFLFSSINFGEKILKAGDKVEIQIMRAGKWKHQQYGDIEVSEATLSNVEKNFNDRARGIDLAVDENHEEDHKALAWFREVYKKGKDALFAKLELTARGAQLLNEGAYKYFSPEISFQKRDEESGVVVKDLLVGGAFTNRPFFKGMQPLMASEASCQRKASDEADFSPVLFHNLQKTMKAKKLLEMIGAVAASEKIAKSTLAQMNFLFGELDAETKQEILPAFSPVLQRFSDENDGADGAAVPPVAPPVDAADVEAEAKAKADAEAAKAEADAKAAADTAAAEAEAKAKEEADAAAAADGGEKKPLEANDKGEVTVKLAELEAKDKQFKEMQSELAKQVKENRTAKISEKVKAMTFSETTKKGVVLPKDAAGIVEFAVSLSEVQCEKFLALMESQSKTASIFQELGGEGASTTPEAAMFSEAKATAMAQGSTEEQATAAATEFVAQKKARGEL